MSLTAEVDAVGSGGDGASVCVHRAARHAAVPGDFLLVEPGITRLTPAQAVRLNPASHTAEQCTYHEK